MYTCACTNGDEDEPQGNFTYARIVGKWETVSYYYYTSGGYFVPSMVNEHFEFTNEQTYTHNNDGTIRTGTFFFDPKENHLHCEETNGWNLDIKISFESENKAMFDITGRTSNQSKIIKVERK